MFRRRYAFLFDETLPQEKAELKAKMKASGSLVFVGGGCQSCQHVV
jgi:hypothetical protein